jgi:hypothetical protein
VQPIDSICSTEEHRRCVGDTTFLLAAWQKILVALAIENQIPSGVMGRAEPLLKRAVLT